jgi:hypothetical protein
VGKGAWEPHGYKTTEASQILHVLVTFSGGHGVGVALARCDLPRRTPVTRVGFSFLKPDSMSLPPQGGCGSVLSHFRAAGSFY